MSMRGGSIEIREVAVEVPHLIGADTCLKTIGEAVVSVLGGSDLPVRFVVTGSGEDRCRCEAAVLSGDWREGSGSLSPGELFRCFRRPYCNQDRFNVVHLVPTGIGAEIGGHSGDAGPTARLLAGVCDTLITHPNVLNAADINEMPPNALYVEGSVIARLLAGTVWLEPVRSNRVLVIMEPHPEPRYRDATVNMVSAARAAAGIACTEVAVLPEPLNMWSSYAASGRAVGRIGGYERLDAMLAARAGTYDAVALATRIEVPACCHTEYFRAGNDDMVNPWGGVEAMLTHAVSLRWNVPSAHAPMMSSSAVQALSLGRVDARKAAEPVSVTYLFCVLKGLHRAPRVRAGPVDGSRPGLLGAADIHALVIPDGCVGIPTLAACEQGIPVIAVRGNRNAMRNDLRRLPFSPGLLLYAEDYLQAAGILAALRTGVSLESVRRPIGMTPVSEASRD